jgi:hypothetical protein
MRRTFVVAAIIVFLSIPLALLNPCNAYSNNAFGFSITPPNGWNTNEDQIGLVVSFLQPQSYANIGVTALSTTASLSQRAIVEKASLQDAGFTVESESYSVVSQMSCYEFIVSKDFGSYDVKERMLIFTEEGREYGVVYAASPQYYEMYMPTFESCLKTFRPYASATEDNTTPSNVIQTYEPVTTITGSSDQTTNYFNIATNEWKLTWSYTPKTTGAEFALFSVFIYPKGENTFYVDAVTKMGGTDTNGMTYVHEGSKNYYFKIIASNLQDYTITVEAQSRPSPTPTQAPLPTPSVPEFPIVVIILFLSIATISIVTLSKKRFVTQ